MNSNFQRCCQRVIPGFVLAASCAMSALGGDRLEWNTNQNRVSADIQSGTLSNLLEQIAGATHWQVFVEPDTLHNVSAKFTNLSPGEALPLLLGDVNFALLPETNRNPRLFVFRTSRQNATQLVRPVKAAAPKDGPKVIPNELVVRLKPGVKIDDLARLLGAKVTGRIESLNAYRLQFGESADAAAAREQLANNPDVAGVDGNFSIDRPAAPQGVMAGVPIPQLQLKPPPDSGRVIVGLIDTAVQPLGNNLDQFVQKQLSLAGDAPADATSLTHGTAMTETILRSLQDATKGATSVQILPVDVYGANGTTSTFDVANGIVLAVNKGARVVNLSLGSAGDSSLLQQVVQSASSQNILLIAAAGNEPVTTPFYPAAYPGVTAVTAVDQGQIASYANRGSFVSLGAPGVNLIAFGNKAFEVEGTSVSSALMSGLAAGYIDQNQSTSAQVQSFLRKNYGIKITWGEGSPKGP